MADLEGVSENMSPTHPDPTGHPCLGEHSQRRKATWGLPAARHLASKHNGFSRNSCRKLSDQSHSLILTVGRLIHLGALWRSHQSDSPPPKYVLHLDTSLAEP